MRFLSERIVILTAPPTHPSVVVANTGLFVDVGGSADAVGTQTSTIGVAQTLAGGGMALGFAAAIAYAQNDHSGASPHTAATTFGDTGGGGIATSATNTISIGLPHGPSLTGALTFVGAYTPDPVSAHLTHDTFSGLSIIHNIA